MSFSLFFFITVSEFQTPNPRRNPKRRTSYFLEMAQAARLSLRMQKELKLLLTDPPPGVSLPMLSNDASDLSSSTTLSSIDAQIEGPEGTVYAKGIFNIKIQIPERYPFQPPNVTFATPIYHPNIDNGGRICLDILNLPPKGAWQPSLNISTVLTSIGLLLSEPNPDDGLMCEASREYKYNRQTFDQKARSLTERYVKAGDSGNSSGGRSTPLNPNTSTIEVEGVDLEFKNVEADNTSCKKLSGVRRKLSLESSGPSQKRNDDNKGAVPQAHKLSLSQAQSLSKVRSSKLSSIPQADNHDEHQLHVAKAVNDSITSSSKKLSGINRKLSLESLSPFHRRNSDDRENMAGFHQSSVSHPKILSMASSKSLSPQVGRYVEQHSEQARDIAENRPPRRNDVGKENMIPFHSHCPAMTSSKLSMMFQNSNCDKQHHVHNGKAEDGGINTETKKQCSINKMPLLEISGPSHSSDGDNMENLPHNDRSELELSITSSNSMIPPTSNCDGPQLRQEHVARKKLSGVSRKLCLGSAAPSTRMGSDKKQDLVSIQKSSKSNLMLQDVKADNEQPYKNHVQEAANGNTKQQDEDASLINDAVIVLDSEDSEEEVKGPKRSRLSLTRKRMVGKATIKPFSKTCIAKPQE